MQPKASETNDDKSGDSSENLEPQTSTSPTRQENEQEQIPSTSQTTASSDYSSTTASSELANSTTIAKNGSTGHKQDGRGLGVAESHPNKSADTDSN
mgnify:CR=1 FL=1